MITMDLDAIEARATHCLNSDCLNGMCKQDKTILALVARVRELEVSNAALRRVAGHWDGKASEWEHRLDHLSRENDALRAMVPVAVGQTWRHASSDAAGAIASIGRDKDGLYCFFAMPGWSPRVDESELRRDWRLVLPESP